MSAATHGAPVPPPLPISRSTQPPPTQVEFLLSQVRATLRYLSEIGGFDPSIYRRIHELLIAGTIDTNPQHANVPVPASTSRSGEDSEEIGKKNAWLRKALSETSILPSTVETALSLTAGPLLSDSQKDAIVELVEYSQKGMANKLTDPTLQRRTVSGAKTAKSSTARAVTGWSKGLKASKEKVQSESAEKKERKKREKEEKKQIKEELKRERNEIVRLRQQQMLGGLTPTSGSMSTATMPQPGRAGTDSVNESIAALQLSHEEATTSSESDDERPVTLTNHAPVNAHHWQIDSDSIADTATLTVLSDPITDGRGEVKSSVGGTNTTFVVEPGLAISCSLVVVRGRPQIEESVQLAKKRSTSSPTSASQIGGRVLDSVPPPPPSHPEVLAIRRQSGSHTPLLAGAAQPPIPPRPHLSDAS